MYFLWIVFFIFLVSYIESNGYTKKIFCINNIPRKNILIIVIFFIIFSVLLGLQYNVGTDYFSYVKIFSDKNVAYYYYQKQEYLFYFFSCLIVDLNLHPQFGFVFLSLIQFFCITTFVKFLKINSSLIFFFLFFTVSTFFFNQTNVIRQYTAATILLLFVKYTYEKKYIRMIISLLCASMFHISAILFIPMFLIVKIFRKKLPSFVWIVYLIISVIMIRVNFVSLMISLVPFLSRYSHYLDSVWGTNQISLINILTKIIYIPFYLFSLKALKKMDNKKDVMLFQLGFFSYGIKLICLSSSMLNRFTVYFEFFTILPLYYLFYDIYDKVIKIKYFNQLFVFIFYCITVGLLCLKTLVIPAAEYDYQSIFMAMFKGIYDI